ncbi:hypothetical protein GYMLUDRAFT_245284 [Collybiopsis luxurians FD-317 M1]|uniref:F-box domain-containing protein n=1 Tax=Collybiopsis luxurians FD-317 M1 TaxID=944289 RepID=A0A0D0BVP4_9AGAR|nr:hypothetical protein GYMLUDRAFT_245284 [Collybiopsis luxurians FD-317 M1]
MSSPGSEPNFENIYRRFPNEIFTLIVDGLTDNLPALRNTSLVCKDFAALAQPWIFRIIRLEAGQSRVPVEHLPLVRQLGPFLQNPKLVQFVERLHFSSYMQETDRNEDLAHILESMPSLIALYICFPSSRHFQAIEISPLHGALKELYIDMTDPLRPTDWASFENMLASLTTLEVLAIHALNTLSEGPRKVILPRTLKIAAFINTSSGFGRAVALGLESSYPSSLRTIFLKAHYYESHSELWRGLDIDTQIVLDGSPSGEKALQGFRATKLICSCIQSKKLARLLCHFVHKLPDPVREIVIDMDACGRDDTLQPDEIGREQDWVELDSRLMKRHELGLLDRVCFRCTKHDWSAAFSFSLRSANNHRKVEDRTILNRVESLLPRSTSLGYLEVDRDMVFFEPTM